MRLKKPGSQKGWKVAAATALCVAAPIDLDDSRGPPAVSGSTLGATWEPSLPAARGGAGKLRNDIFHWRITRAPAMTGRSAVITASRRLLNNSQIWLSAADDLPPPPSLSPCIQPRQPSLHPPTLPCLLPFTPSLTLLALSIPQLSRLPVHSRQLSPTTHPTSDPSPQSDISLSQLQNCCWSSEQFLCLQVEAFCRLYRPSGCSTKHEAVPPNTPAAGFLARDAVTLFGEGCGGRIFFLTKTSDWDRNRHWDKTEVSRHEDMMGPVRVALTAWIIGRKSVL